MNLKSLAITFMVLTPSLMADDRAVERQPSTFGETSKVELVLVDGNQKPLTDGSLVSVSISDKTGKLLFFDRFAASTYRKTLALGSVEPPFILTVRKPGYNRFIERRFDPRLSGWREIMMLPHRKLTYDFSKSAWDSLNSDRPSVARLLAAGIEDNVARERYERLLNEKPDCLAALLNLLSALKEPDPELELLHFFKEIVWSSLAQDRFFAYADSRLIPYLDEQTLPPNRRFNRLAHFDLFLHRGLKDAPGLDTRPTRSYKQVELSEANLQITLHERARRIIGETDCVLVEVDIDYFKRWLPHTFLEVVPHLVTGKKTSPRTVYRLHWLAEQGAFKHDFAPGFGLVAKAENNSTVKNSMSASTVVRR